MKKKNKKNLPLSHKSSNAAFYNIYWLLALLLFISFMLYKNSLNNQFVWDDEYYILKNGYIQNLDFQSIKNIFSKSYFANYHPLTTLTYAIEFSFFKDNPLPYRLTNIILHLANILLVFVFIKLVSKRDDISFITALLFAIHPLHVESVAWISGRKDVLYTFFFLWALIYFTKYLQSGKSIKYVLFCFLFFIASLMSKSAAVVLPLVLVLLYWYIEHKIRLKDLLVTLPFFAFSLLFGIIAMHTQEAEIGIVNVSELYTWPQRILLVLYSFYFYISRFLIPLDMSALHPYPLFGLGLEYYIAPFFLMGCMGIYFILSKTNKKIWAFGGAFYILTIMLLIQIIPFGNAIVAERYTYVPYIGLGFVFAHFITAFSKKTYVYVVGILYVLFLSLSSFNYIKTWQDEGSLWTQVIEKYPQSAIAYNNRGIYFSIQNEQEKAYNDFNAALELDSTYAFAYYNRGNTKAKMGLYNDALVDYDKALQYKKDYAEAYNNKGSAFKSLGLMEEALHNYLQAYKLKPKDYLTIENVAISYFQLEDYENALLYFEKVVDLMPTYGRAYSNRAGAKYYLTDIKGACKDWEKAIKLGYSEASNNYNSLCYEY